MTIKHQLIRLGATNPELRGDIRPILKYVGATSKNASDPFTEEFNEFFDERTFNRWAHDYEHRVIRNPDITEIELNDVIPGNVVITLRNKLLSRDPQAQNEALYQIREVAADMIIAFPYPIQRELTGRLVSWNGGDYFVIEFEF